MSSKMKTHCQYGSSKTSAYEIIEYTVSKCICKDYVAAMLISKSRIQQHNWIILGRAKQKRATSNPHKNRQTDGVDKDLLVI